MKNTTETPWGEVGYVTYKRTYARAFENRTEEWSETIERIIDACNEQLGCDFNSYEQQSIRHMMLNLKGTVAGRFLWQLGTKTVDRLGLPSLQNCAFTVVDSPIRPFTWAFEMLMLGSGVGFNIQRENVYQLPKILKEVKITRKDTNDADFIVPDSREGWTELLKRVLKASFEDGEGFTYATHLIRSKGSPIKGFGGTASGPEDIVWGVGEINAILNSKSEQRLSPVDCLDIMNILGKVVVSGNVRRSAQIALGDYDDLEFLRAKRWDLGNIPNWRAMSNNSVVCDNIENLPEEFWEGYKGNGEPYGLINLKASRRMGRTGETQYPDAKVQGYNPSLRKGTKVWTTEGIVPIDSLEGKDFYVRTLKGEEAPAKCWLSNPSAPLYEVTLQGGHTYYSTKEHKWPIHTPQGWVKCETSELKEGHLLPVVKFDSISKNGKLGEFSDGFFIGWLYGDGGIHLRKDNQKRQLNLIVSKKDDLWRVSDTLLNKLNTLKNVPSKWAERKGNKELSCSSASVFEYLDSFGVTDKATSIPTSIWKGATDEFVRGFISGIFSSDGSVDSNYKSAKIRLSQKNENVIREISEVLGFYGIKTTLHVARPKLKGVVFPQWVLTVASRENIAHFRKIFELSVKHKQEALMDISTLKVLPLQGSTQKIISVKKTDMTEPVWDISVDDSTHCFQLAHVITGNCAEQSLEPFESCCLAEIFLPNIESTIELKNIATMLYRINKHSLAIPCSLKETEDIVHKNMRMGIGVTGYMQATEEQRSWLSSCYTYLREYDREYSRISGFPTSIKLTTVKPSGTLSLLAGVTPGAHPGYSEHYIRRIRMSADSELVETCKKAGYDVEYVRNFDGTEDYSTVVVSFPCKFPEGTTFAKDMTAINQLEVIKRLQSEWSDNAVSVTIYYKKEELSDIQEWLKENYVNVKSVSFLLHNEHGFDQAPLEEIDEKTYEAMKQSTTPIRNISDISTVELDSSDCDSGACPTR